MIFEIARIIVRKGKAYIPTFSGTPQRESINVEPVYAVGMLDQVRLLMPTVSSRPEVAWYTYQISSSYKERA